MIGLLHAERREQGWQEGFVPRLRHHMRMLPGKQDPLKVDGRIRADLRHLLARLRRIRARGGDYQEVQISPHVHEVIKTLKIVGNELLVLLPKRKGA